MVKGKEMEKKKSEGLSYCVTGANGYIGSWLVKTLLHQGFTVHATLRDPAKCTDLVSMWQKNDRLRLFRADLREEGSFDDAVKGCDGVFHVAASMEFGVLEDQNIESYVQSNIIEPAINGTLNLLRSCAKSESVKRVVFTSSISTITAKDDNGKWKSIVDESCQNSIDRVWKTKPNGWVYVLSKFLCEEAAFKFATENGIDLVSVITATVAGQFITPNVPSSIKVLLSPITGDSELHSILSAVNERMGSIGLVHIEDICGAHIFLMQNEKSNGRYICCAQSCQFSELLSHLFLNYPCPNLQRFVSEGDPNQTPPDISSKKLMDLGFKYKHCVQDIIHQTIKTCLDFGFLSPVEL